MFVQLSSARSTRPKMVKNGFDQKRPQLDKVVQVQSTRDDYIANFSVHCNTQIQIKTQTYIHTNIKLYE